MEKGGERVRVMGVKKEKGGGKIERLRVGKMGD